MFLLARTLGRASANAVTLSLLRRLTYLSLWNEPVGVYTPFILECGLVFSYLNCEFCFLLITDANGTICFIVSKIIHGIGHCRLKLMRLVPMLVSTCLEILKWCISFIISLNNSN